MDVSIYVGKRVKVELTNSFFYEGVVINCDEDSIVIKDIKDQIVTISIATISFIREVQSE